MDSRCILATGFYCRPGLVVPTKERYGWDPFGIQAGAVRWRRAGFDGDFNSSLVKGATQLRFGRREFCGQHLQGIELRKIRWDLQNGKKSNGCVARSLLKKLDEMVAVVEGISSRLSKIEISLKGAIRLMQKPLVVALLLGLLLLRDPANAIAASGGRVGGKAFSSSRSYSAPSGTYSAPRRSFSFSAPYAPSPFFGGYGPSLYVGPAYGFGFGGIGSLFILALAAVFISGFLSDRGSGGLLQSTEKVTVLKLQVGLLGLAKTLQTDLDRMADRADTSTPGGLHFVLTETILSLLRHPDYCISGTSLSEVKRTPEAGEEKFNQLSLEERGKFDEETLVNVDKMRKRSFLSKGGDRFRNEYIVVTILVAAEGKYELPSINGTNDLRTALTRLGSIPADSIQAVEVLWTPQDTNDTLTETELLRDYPLLRSF